MSRDIDVTFWSLVTGVVLFLVVLGLGVVWLGVVWLVHHDSQNINDFINQCVADHKVIIDVGDHIACVPRENAPGAAG